MQNFKKYSIIILIGICFNQKNGLELRNFIPITPPLSSLEKENDTSNFSMNQGFSLMTKSGKFGSNTMGIYSNRMKYDFSDKLSLNSTFHLMNSTPSFYDSNQNFDVEYKLGIGYKFSENSQIFFQFSNIGYSENNKPNMFTLGF